MAKSPPSQRRDTRDDERDAQLEIAVRRALAAERATSASPESALQGDPFSNLEIVPMQPTHLDLTRFWESVQDTWANDAVAQERPYTLLDQGSELSHQQLQQKKGGWRNFEIVRNSNLAKSSCRLISALCSTGWRFWLSASLGRTRRRVRCSLVSFIMQ